jgi:hypothetical protein
LRQIMSSPFEKNISLYLGGRHTSEQIHPAR